MPDRFLEERARIGVARPSVIPARRIGERGPVDRAAAAPPGELMLQVPIAIDPLVSKEDFVKLQEILDLNKAQWASARAQGSRFEATGIARCECGEKLYSSSGKRKFDGLRDYYRCRSRQMKTGCSQKPVKREDLDYTIQAFIGTFFTEPDILRSLLSKSSRIGGHRPDGQQQRLEQACAEINRLNKERARLLTFAVKGVFSEQQVQEEARRIDSEISGWNTAVRQVEREIRSASAMDEKAVAAAVASVFAEFEFLNPTHRKALLQKFVSALYVDRGAITKVTVRLPPEVAKMCIHMGKDSSRQSVQMKPET